MEAKVAIEKAKTKLLLDNAYFGRLAMQFDYQPADVQTMATDGVRVLYNPHFVKECAEQKTLQGVLMHEVLHIALLHPDRRTKRDHQIWNMSCDFVINSILRDSGLSLPNGSLFDHKYQGYSAEEVYNELKNEVQKLPPQPRGGQGEDNMDPNTGSYLSGNDDDDDDEQKPDDDEQKPKEQKPKEQNWGEHDQWKKDENPERWKKEARDRKAKVKGNAPESMKREWKEFVGSSQNWRVALARYLESSPIDYSFVPPDRRFSDSDIMLPDFKEENLENIVVAVDTSGSIDEDMLNVFMAEVRSIMASYPHLTGYFCYCDVQVYDWCKFSFETKLPDPKGFGGTDFRPVFNKVASESVKPSVLLYFTDGAGTFPDNVPNYPVIWALFGCEGYGISPPFGTKLRIRKNGGDE